MELAEVLLIFLFAFCATFVQRVTGFGFGILFMTVIPYIMPSYGEATALSGALAMTSAFVTGFQYIRYVPWKKLVVIMLTFLLVSYFAVLMVKEVDSATMKHYLGGFLILIGLYFLFINGKFRMKPSIPVQLGMGTVSGVMGGLFGIQGPPAVIYFISCTDSKEEYMAIAQWYFVIGNAAMTVFRAKNGFFTQIVAEGWLIGIGAILLGLWLGGKVYHRLPMEKLRKTVYVFIVLSGVVAIFV